MKIEDELQQDSSSSTEYKDFISAVESNEMLAYPIAFSYLLYSSQNASETERQSSGIIFEYTSGSRLDENKHREKPDKDSRPQLSNVKKYDFRD